MVLQENHLIFHLKIKKLKDNFCWVIGQSSLPVLSRLGSHMYWNNTWLNPFNKKIFFNKTLFIENIFIYLFSDKLFNFFFTEVLKKFKKKLFKLILLKKIKQLHLPTTLNEKKLYKKKNLSIKKKIKYNFSKIWFIKYNSYILFTTFVFFYFKIKKKKNTSLLLKPPFKKKLNIFWRKKRGINFKKNTFTSSSVHLKF